MARKVMHGIDTKKFKKPVRASHIGPAVGIADAQGLTQPAINSPVGNSFQQPNAQIPAPGIAGGVPSEGPRAMRIGGKTTSNNPALIHKNEKVDAGISETVERHQRTPNQADKINPPVRLKFDGSGEDTFKDVNRTGVVRLPTGSLVQPAPPTSTHQSPDDIVRRNAPTKRFQF